MKHNYLNNKDILKEIHKSKNSYCWFADPVYADYDMIVPEGHKITKKDILQAKKNRAERLGKLSLEAAQAEGIKGKLEDHMVKHTKILEEDLVFRMMTWEHVPMQEVVKVPKKKSKSAEPVSEEDVTETEYDDELEDTKPTKYVKVNFPPFQHVIIQRDADDNMQLTVVGISHWKGDPTTGHYSRDHGAMTNKLAHMFMKLCERYATRSNWRGYTYNDEMRSQALLQLSQIGLQFDESKSQNPFAYYTAAITNSFTRVLNIEKRNQNLRDDILQMNNLNPSYTRQMANSSSGGHEE